MMRPLCIAFFLGLAAASCPSGWTAAPNNICYKRSHGLKNFKGCYESCTAIGGTPPCIRSNDHKDILIGMVDGNHFFTGAYQEPGTLGDENTRNGWHDGTLEACRSTHFNANWQWTLDNQRRGVPRAHFDDWGTRDGKEGASCGQENCAFLGEIPKGDSNTVHDIGCSDEIGCVCETLPGWTTPRVINTTLLSELIAESHSPEGFSCPNPRGREKGGSFPFYLIGPVIMVICCAFPGACGLVAMSRAKRSAAERNRLAAARQQQGMPMQPMAQGMPMQPMASNMQPGMAVATATAVPMQPGAIPVASAIPVSGMPVAQAVPMSGGMPVAQATVVPR